MTKALIFATAAAIATGFAASTAHAEPTTPYEIEQGCPAELPTFKAMPNANFTVLDRTTLSHDCLSAMRDQNGDRDKNNDDDK